MILSELSIKRPVLAVVMSLLIVVAGVVSYLRLTVREFPDIDPPVVSVHVTYPGAAAAVVETRVTQVLEDALVGIEGVETMESQSGTGSARVTVEFALTRDIEAATNDVRDAVSRVIQRLPEEADPPEIAKADLDSDPVLWLNLRGEQFNNMQLTDYAERYVVDRLTALNGVARVIIGGEQRYAMRIWLERDAMAAREVTVSDIEAALRNENVELPAGEIESIDRDFVLRIERGYQTPSQFEQIPLRKGKGGYVVRLGDIARVEVASAERRNYYRGNGKLAIGLGIIKTSTANSLDVSRQARAELAHIQPTLPEGIELLPATDRTEYIEAALDRVYWTLAEAMLLVFVLIWVSLGNLRTALIPAIAVPISLTGSLIALYALGFTINLFTLLALVLSIGLVVDDAIVVLENAQRRADLGEPPLVAARRGTSQVAFAVIATTLVLVTVFLPVGFMEGNVGRMFRELSVALAAAVAISAFVSLTLTPMLCSKLVSAHRRQFGKAGRVARILAAINESYCRVVARIMQVPNGPLLATLLIAVAACVALSVFLAVRTPTELAPSEDRGMFFIIINGPEGAGFDYTVQQVQLVEALLAPYIGADKPIVRANARAPGGQTSGQDMHTGRISVSLQKWQERKVSANQLAEMVRSDLEALPGARVFAQVRSGFSRTRAQPFQLVLGGPTYAELAQWRDRILLAMEQNEAFRGVDSDFKETRPQIRIDIDRARASDLGVPVAEIGRTLETTMGGRRVTTYVSDGEEYDVILQAGRDARTSPIDLANTYVRSRSGTLVSLANLTKFREIAEAGSFNRFNRLRAVTIGANLAPGYPLGDAVAWAKAVVDEELPEYAQVDWKGESRDFQRAGGAVLLTFAMALLVVYLVLAAQFESFIHPLVTMLTVPLAVMGALIGIALTGGTLNLFSQIGIIMLVGLAAKNGILIVEFANQLRDDGRSVAEAITEAAAVRLRPILMTSAATIMGAIPLVVFGGPGSESRSAIGVVVIFGVTFSTLLSLFVVPAFYRLLAPFTRSRQALAHQLESLEARTPVAGGRA